MASAELLIEESYYAPSVHCSYYSVFQLMKYRFVSKSGISFEEYNTQSPSIGSHVYLLDSFLIFLSDPRERRVCKRNVGDL
jgi:hypothetical protein